MSDEKLLPLEGDEDEFYEPDLLTLEDEAGVEHTFEVLDAADIGERHYLALVPYIEDAAESLAEDAEMIIMRVSEDNGDEVLDLVEDDEELYEASQVFMTRLSEVYDIDIEELAAQLQQEEEQ